MTRSTDGNLFADVPQALREEEITELLLAPGVKIERIVSTGQATPAGEWYDSPWGEWVIVLTGSAGLKFEDQDATRTLKPGDYLFIAAHRRHRMEWTEADETTVWLAVHFAEETAGGISRS